ncbi:hypothetical protein AURDEDRAFT_114587 [Auricularia subglabra TFB-10046 SS5]|nr:hypothetical protein AURDEDRAFT_114587 [Auricularia subglabra TFB-10046 SS5]
MVEAAPRSPSWSATRSNSDPTPSSDERVLLFPGWATRKYHHAMSPDSQNQFTIDVYVSGYVANFTRPEAATRAQKALLYAAKNFATLPKLVKTVAQPQQEDSPPPIQYHLTPSTEELLATKKLPPRPTEINDELERIALAQMYEDETSTQFSQDSFGASIPIPDDMEHGSPPVSMDGLSPDEVRRLHLNLHTRLRAFWSTPLPGRVIRLSLYLEGDPDEPLLVQNVLTDAQGAFAIQLQVPWERMIAHPRAQLVAHGEPGASPHFVRLTADLLPSPARDKAASPRELPTDSFVLPLTHTRVRLISDVDDTVKNSDIVHGARAAFHNVFVKQLDDVVIHEMRDWYKSMYARGVRFHYVSNSPWELLPVLNDFIRVSQLPEGSLKLKYYGGAREFFSNIREPAAQRKRGGVLEVLDAFLDAQFILVGDTGEQDMELYAALARDRPFQILAVFVRDVTSPSIAAKKDKEEKEERMLNFVERVRRAREMVPSHIAFRVFTDPAECVEAQLILDRLEIG